MKYLWYRMDPDRFFNKIEVRARTRTSASGASTREASTTPHGCIFHPPTWRTWYESPSIASKFCNGTPRFIYLSIPNPRLPVPRAWVGGSWSSRSRVSHSWRGCWWWWSPPRSPAGDPRIRGRRRPRSPPAGTCKNGRQISRPPQSSIGDPDSLVFGPPGSGSISQRYRWIRLRILPFSHNCVERTEIMPEKLNFNKKLGKNKFLSLKMIRLWAS
jgi:hypothetical protein